MNLILNKMLKLWLPESVRLRYLQSLISGRKVDLIVSKFQFVIFGFGLISLVKGRESHTNRKSHPLKSNGANKKSPGAKLTRVLGLLLSLVIKQ